MKAIYINLDPYLAAVAAWLKDATYDGDTGTYDKPLPSFVPLPLAVTIPLAQTAGLYLACDNEGATNSVTVDGESLGVQAVDANGSPFDPDADFIAKDEVPGLSAYAPTMKYQVVAVSGDSMSFRVIVYDENDTEFTIPFTILVRRDTASGPVDLVDFTPPAAPPSAADIKSALVAAGIGALDGVNLGGAQLVAGGEGSNNLTMIGTVADGEYRESGPLVSGDDIQTAIGVGSNS